jgi:hypothetical protein
MDLINGGALPSRRYVGPHREKLARVGSGEKLLEKKISGRGSFRYVVEVTKTFLHDIQVIFRTGPFRRIAESH